MHIISSDNSAVVKKKGIQFRFNIKYAKDCNTLKMPRQQWSRELMTLDLLNNRSGITVWYGLVTVTGSCTGRQQCHVSFPDSCITPSSLAQFLLSHCFTVNNLYWVTVSYSFQLEFHARLWSIGSCLCRHWEFHIRISLHI